MLLIMISISAEIKLQRKLYTALRTAQYTALRSSNKIEHIEDTHGWVLNLDSKYDGGGGKYSQNYDGYDPAVDATANRVYNVELQELSYPRLQWFYHPNNAMDTIRTTVILFLNEGIDPLKHPLNEENLSSCNLSWDIVPRVFLSYMFTSELRMGNCGPLASLVAKYLWENSEGIDSIEFFKANAFDHSWIVVNRESNGNDPKKWGRNCWIVDGWCGKIYRGVDFKKNMEEIIDFRKRQDEEIEKKLGKKAESIIQGCDFISISEPPSRDFLSSLSLKSHAVYVYVPDFGFYYYNKIMDEIIEINLTKDNLEKINEKFKLNDANDRNKTRSLSQQEREYITLITDHIHYDEIGEVVFKIEPKIHKYPFSQEHPIEYYYTLANSCNSLSSFIKNSSDDKVQTPMTQKIYGFWQESYREHKKKSQAFKEDILKLANNPM